MEVHYPHCALAPLVVLIIFVAESESGATGVDCIIIPYWIQVGILEFGPCLSISHLVSPSYIFDWWKFHVFLFIKISGGLHDGDAKEKLLGMQYLLIEILRTRLVFVATVKTVLYEILFVLRLGGKPWRILWDFQLEWYYARVRNNDRIKWMKKIK